MKWTSLGHLGWLVEVGGLRVAVDPTLDDTLMEGALATLPARRIDPSGVQPHVIVLTGAAPDRFDLPSLGRLAPMSPEAVVIAADPLVAEACERLGFGSVHVVGPNERVDLGQVTLWTVPGCDASRGWGFVLDDGRVAGWNQAGIPLADPRAVRQGLLSAERGLGEGLVRRLRWVALQWRDPLAGPAGVHPSPEAGHRRALERALALPRWACLHPAGGGTVRVGPGAGESMGGVSEERFHADIWRRDPQREGILLTPGDQVEVTPGGVRRVGRAGWCRLTPSRTACVIGRHLQVPLEDDVPVAAPERHLVDRFLEDTLLEGLRRSWVPRGDGARCLRVKVLWAEEEQAVSYAWGPMGWWMQGQAQAGADREEVIVGSELVAVLKGEASWARPLGSGRMRVRGDASDAPPHPVLFSGLSWDRSLRRYVEGWLRERLR